jgi:hypothetical protein
MAFGCAQRADTKMVRAIATAACALALAGCSAVSSNLPSFNLPSLDLADPPSTSTVTVHSNPPGAEARASIGSSCHTPCAMSVPVNQGFTITYTLEGFLPETVSVRSIPAEKGALFDMTPPRLEPNPVWAELRPVPPPEPPKRRQRQ